MKTIIAMVLVFCTLAGPQSAPAAPQQHEKEKDKARALAEAQESPSPFVAKVEDVKSIEAIVAALYDVISGPPERARDWERFSSLFLPEARLVYTGKTGDGKIVFRAVTVEEYVNSASASFSKEGFFEHGIANQLDRFGNIAQVFSTYESRHQRNEAPFARGINSLQLLNDGKRWWVVSVVWDSERPDNPIPPKYLPGK